MVIKAYQNQGFFYPLFDFVIRKSQIRGAKSYVFSHGFFKQLILRILENKPGTPSHIDHGDFAGGNGSRKKWIRDLNGKTKLKSITKGLIDFEDVRSEMANRGIELRGGDADEAPECYKRLDDVLRCQGDTIKILFRLHPVGVAMAGGETFDPYKD